MADPQVSPISQLLHTLGITREDLNKRSDQMRQFLTADDALSSRVHERDSTSRPRSGSDLHSSSRSTGSSRLSARSLSRASSSSVRETSPPTTPVKSEPNDGQIPHRRMDSMEMVLERQRRHRKSRKERERDPSRSIQHPPSPSPSNASQSSHSLDSFMHLRDEPQTSSAATSDSGHSGSPETPAVEPPPVTPQKSKYYRDHTNLSAQSQSSKDVICKTETPTPTRPIAQAFPQSQALPQYYAYPSYMGYPHYLPVAYRPAQASSSAIPITPQPPRTQPRKRTASPLPPSSPPLASSPMSSPVRRVVNLVSSPGPMGPEPEETEYDNLPYKLPPGPYSPNKPDLSYAALVGRAILSSPEHRLTLQEIYDWITIVYPHYKRGETTWMNSIRHVLSTTLVFRKVPRDRSVGRTLWAIYDQDLECFKDGGFKKQLCKDYINSNEAKERVSSAKAKGKTRKRADDDDGQDRKAKKAKKEQTVMGSSDSSVIHSSFMAQAPLGSHPLFPSTRPTPHLQPYYQNVLPPQTTFPSVPADVIFPPLPAAAAFNRVMNTSGGSSSSNAKTDDASIPDSSTPSTQSRSSPAPLTLSSSSSTFSSSSSVPELTPNRGSSTSPPSSQPATSDIDVDMHDGRPTSASSGVYRAISSTVIADPDDDLEIDASVSAEDDEDSIFNTTLLGPVRFWGQSPKASGGLQPGIELLNFDVSDEEDNVLARPKKGKRKEARSSKPSTFPPIPTSPTLNVRSIQNKSSDSTGRPSTPVASLPAPSTPPRSTVRQHQISSIRTPLSHKGLHMSPSASLAHYKSNLDPPPVVSGGVAPLDVTTGPDDDADPMRTPRKRGVMTNSSSVFGQPVTPRKLIFSAGAGDSPFRTPGLPESPFRTPRSRAIFDPHDPGTLLHEELNRMGSYEDSPAGIFGKGRSSLLYDSPGLDGPAKWW